MLSSSMAPGKLALDNRRRRRRRRRPSKHALMARRRVTDMRLKCQGLKVTNRITTNLQEHGICSLYCKIFSLLRMNCHEGLQCVHAAAIRKGCASIPERTPWGRDDKLLHLLEGCGSRTASGIVNPGLQTAQAIKAMRWASYYEPIPVFSLVLVPKPATSSSISECLQHPAAQCLLTLPRNACRFSVPDLLHDACLADGCLPGPALQVVVAGKQAGLAMYMSDWPDLHAGLRAA